MNEVFVRVEDFKLLKKYFKNYDFVSIDELCGLVEELDYEIDVLEEKVKDMEDDIEQFYEPKKFNPYEEYGISERDFIWKR